MSTCEIGGHHRHAPISGKQGGTPGRSLFVAETYDPGVGWVWRDYGWVTPQGTSVRDPNGQMSDIATSAVLGMPRVTGMSQPAGAGCAASSSAIGYDANGNTASQDDFNGNRTCHAYDQVRNLETVRVEGLAGGTACAGATGVTASIPSGSRKITTDWHPFWRLRSKVAEPGRITHYVYNGQADPLANNALASCAPPSAQLPDGTRIAVLCRKVEQATSDSDGSLGFAAAPQAGVPWREERWTYNADGQILSHDGPRTDASDITTNEYYTSTSFSGTDTSAVGYNRGDLKKTTNALNQSTTFDLYNKAGNLLQMSDPNGVVTVNVYDARQRRTSSSVAGQTRAYDYWPTGLLKRVTEADSSWLYYEYDAAHRLYRVSDSLGNYVTYTLDNFGNRTVEDVRDPSNVLRRQLGRGVDALGRVQLITGREGTQ